MNKYKYRLVEQGEDGEENGLKSFTNKKDLVLTAIGDTSIDYIENTLNNPKKEALKGFYIARDKNFESNVFGLPDIKANLKKNPALLDTQKNDESNLYYNNGQPFYKKIEALTGMKFTGIKPSGFPTKNKDNVDIVNTYLSGKIKTGLRWEKIRNNTALKFFTDNKETTSNMINAILTNSGLESGKNYKLGSEVVDENKKLVKEEITEEAKVRSIIKKLLK